MKKLIIIGNGFDIAHGLETSYSDFLKYLKNQIVKVEINKDYTYSINIKGNQCGEFSDIIHKETNGKEDPWIAVVCKPNNKYELTYNPHKNSIYFKTLFQDKNKLGYWSDLESHYFKTLYKNKDKPSNISIINEEFDYLKKLLIEYLNEIEDGVLVHETSELILKNSIFNMIDSKMESQHQFTDYHFVSFNYTSKILNKYINHLKDENFILEKKIHRPIYIHGDLLSGEGNPIIFGYGDENSTNYKELEVLENGNYLKNFKTFQYLRKGQYGQILGYLESVVEDSTSIDSTAVHVQVIGHSLNLTDKALLKTIFEHPNVKEIEVTYHKNESKYFEKLYNVSRIFDNNTDMRKKIVPLEKTFKII